MSHNNEEINTFESKFWIVIPQEMRVSNNPKQEHIIKKHDDAWIFVKLLAYIIDLGISILIFPIIYNVYHYLKWWQTIWQKVMGIRIYSYCHVGIVASIPKLLTRFMIKLWFLGLWTIIWMNLMYIILYGRPLYAAATIYTIVMLICIHGYASTMITNKYHRWLQDIWAGTIVAYDEKYSFKKFLIGLIICAVLCYIIIWIGPNIISWISTHTNGSLEIRYWEVRNRIDAKIVNSFVIFRSRFW